MVVSIVTSWLQTARSTWKLPFGSDFCDLRCASKVSTDIAALVQKLGLVLHLYADDAQAYGWSPPARVDDLLER